MPDALELALAALAQKERTVAELAAWLDARGCEPEATEAALSHLLEIGQLDDSRFARRFAEDKRELRGWGSERIAEALAARGAGSEEIDAALAADPAETQVERAATVLTERAMPVDDEAARGRALAVLVRLGYPSELAYDAVRLAERSAG